MAAKGIVAALVLLALVNSGPVYSNSMQEGLEYNYEYSTRLTAGLRAVGRQEASSAFKAEVKMQVLDQKVVLVQLSNISVGDINSEPLKCKESPDQDFQGIEYRPLEDRDLDNKLQMPFKLQMHKWKLTNITVPDGELSWITNIRRSIAFLFNLPTLPYTNAFDEKYAPYFNEYEYSPFGECISRFSLIPIMEELKLKEIKTLSIEEDIQLGDSSPADLTSQKGRKGSSKTQKGVKVRKGSKCSKGSKGCSDTLTDARGSLLTDKMWRLTRSIDFEQCLDLAQVHTQGLQMVGTKDSRDDCGERHFSRSHDGTFILRGNGSNMRLEKAEVQGVYTVDALGTDKDHITSFAIQTIKLVSVKSIGNYKIENNYDEDLNVVTHIRHDMTPFLEQGRMPREFEAAKPRVVTEESEEYKQFVVTKIREILKSLPGGQSTHIVGDLNAMSQNLIDFSTNDLKTIYDQLTDAERKIFFQVLILSGYGNQYSFFFEKWENGEVSEDIILFFIMNMANNMKDSIFVGVTQDMILSVIENPYLQGLAVMNYAQLANKFCLNPCGYKNNRDYECTVMDCKQFVPTFLYWVTSRLESEETPLWQRLVYLQTLANLHTEKVIPAVHKFLTGYPMEWANDEPIDLRLRIGAIYALRKDNMPSNAKKQVFSLLMALFENQHEHYRVREYALLMLNHWDPPAAWWHRLAISSWQEPNQQVASLIYATIITMAKVNPEARRVVAVVKPAAPNSLSNSHVTMYIKGNSQDMLRYWHDMVLSGNDGGLFPRMIKLYLRLGFLNQQLTGARLSGHFDGTNILKFFEQMFDSIEANESQELVKEMFQEILEQLELEPENTKKNFEAHGFLTLFRSFEAMFSINQEEGHFLPFESASLQMFINQQLLVNTGRITTVVTTEAGTPLLIDMTNPTFISTQSENYQLDFDRGTFKMDTTVRLDTMKETHVKSLVPWNNKAMVAGLESRVEIKLPFEIKGALDIRCKKFSVTFSPRCMKTSVDECENYLLLVSNTPYTVRTTLQYTPRFSSLDDYKEVVPGSLEKHMWPLLPVTGLAMTAIWESDMQPLINSHINNFFSGFYSFSSCSAAIMKPTARKYKFLWKVNFKEAITKSWTFTFNWMVSKQIDYDQISQSQGSDYSQFSQSQGSDYSQYGQGPVDEDVCDDYEDFGQDAEIASNFQKSSSKIGIITQQFSFPQASVVYSIGLGLDFHSDDTRHFEMVLTWAQGFEIDNYGSKMQLILLKGPYALESAQSSCLLVQFKAPYILPLTNINDWMKQDLASAVIINLLPDETCRGRPIVTGKIDLALSPEKKDMISKMTSNYEECTADVDSPNIIPSYDRISVSTIWDDSVATKTMKTWWNRFTDIAHGSLFPFITSDRVNVVGDQKTFNFEAKKLETMWQVDVKKESESMVESISVEQLYIPWWMEELVAPKRSTDSVYESLVTGQNGRPTCVISVQSSFFSGRMVKTFDGVPFEHQLGECWVVAAMDCERGRFVVQVRDSGELEMQILWPESGLFLQITKDSVMVNGEEIDIESTTDNYQLFSTDEFMLLQLTNLMAVKITQSTFSITMVHSLKGSLCGICGNMDGERIADLEGPHGCVYSNSKSKDFQTSWTTSGDGCNTFSLRGRMKPVNAYRESCPKLQYRSAATIFDAYKSEKTCYVYGNKEFEAGNFTCSATEPYMSVSQCYGSDQSRNTIQFSDDKDIVYRCRLTRLRSNTPGVNWAEGDTNRPAGANYPLPGISKPLCGYYTTDFTQVPSAGVEENTTKVAPDMTATTQRPFREITTQSNNVICDGQFEMISGRCLFISGSRFYKTWFEANIHCKDLGGQLMAEPSWEIASYIRENKEDCNMANDGWCGFGIWVAGFHAPYGSWQWITSTNGSGYPHDDAVGRPITNINWYAYDATDDDNENPDRMDSDTSCLKIITMATEYSRYRNITVGLFGDEICENRFPFVCEKVLSNTKVVPDVCYPTERVPCSEYPEGENFPHPTQCNKFLKCVGGSAVVKTCSSGKLYNHLSGWCETTMDIADCMCPSKVALVASCPSQFTKVGQQCLLILGNGLLGSEDLTMTEAEAECKSRGGTLAQLHGTTRTVAEYLKSQNKETWEFWVGAKRYTDEKFYWTSSQTEVNSWEWMDGQPDDGGWNFVDGSEHCVELHVSNSQLNDNDCGEERSFICEAGNDSSFPSFPNVVAE